VAAVIVGGAIVGLAAHRSWFTGGMMGRRMMGRGMMGRKMMGGSGMCPMGGGMPVVGTPVD